MNRFALGLIVGLASLPAFAQEQPLASKMTDAERAAFRDEVRAYLLENPEVLIEAMDEKEKRYGQRWPIDEDFLAALAHMPAASGVALGFDRLVMLATGARHINDVLWTPQ